MRIYILVIICFLSPYLMRSQQVIVTSTGEKIIMYPDGSWRTIEAQDSLLLKQNPQKTDPILFPGNESAENFRNKAEEQNFLIRQAQELKSIILDEDKKVQTEFREATNSQFKASEMLQNAEANKAIIEPDKLFSLSLEYDRAVRQLKEIKTKQKSIKKLSGDVIILTNNPEKIRKNQLEQLKSKYNLFLTHYEHAAVPFSPYSKTYATPAKPSTSTKTSSNTAGAVVTTSIANPTETTAVLIPPANRPKFYASRPFECKFSIDTIDIQSHRRQVQVAPSLIFTHTDPDLRPYFKDKELITGSGAVVKIGPYYYLTIEFQIGSSHSQNNFGALQKESLLRFKLMNGNYISLYNIRTDRGHIDPYSGNTIFTGQYALGKKDLKKLKSSSLDKVRVLWATGYEDYDVYCIDFFKNQLHCLQEAE